MGRVVLITCHALRADRLGIHGCPRETSPNLDAFAREATVFEEAYAVTPLSLPSLASLHTGRLPEELGAVAANVPTLAEQVRAEGVATAAVVAHSFDREASGIDLRRGFEHFDDGTAEGRDGGARMPRGAAETTDAALAWLGRAGEEPFLLWVHYADLQGPYDPPEPWLSRFLREPPDDQRLPRAEGGRGSIPLAHAVGAEDRPAVYRDRYDAAIAYLDSELERLLDGLRSGAAWERTYVVFTSDHGQSLGERGQWFTSGTDLHREAVRVPLVVRAPEGVAAPAARNLSGARRVAAVAGHLDVAPTVLAALGIEPPRARGTSLLVDELPSGRVLPQVLTVPGESTPRAFAASDGRFRLLWSEGRPDARLFDIRADPAELRDLSSRDTARLIELIEGRRRFLGGSGDEPLQVGLGADGD